MWQSSKNGPDWVDVRSVMAAVEGLHGCMVSVMLLCDGRRDGSTMRVDVLAMKSDGEASLAQPGVGIGALWPHRNHATLEGLIYKLLMDLDYECGKVFWSQQDMPF